MTGRNPLLILILLAFAAAGCMKKETVDVAASRAPAEGEHPFGLAAYDTRSFAPEQAGSSAAPLGDKPAADTLAYEHTVAIELGQDLLQVRVQEIQRACQADRQSGCTLLDVSVSSDAYVPSASIRMRLAPGSVDSVIDLAARNGEIRSRTTHAEDLAQPVADTERQLALLTTHRSRLEEFMKNKSLTVDQLITVSRELATVQAQIEQQGTTHANLRRRIDTDLLTITLSVPRGQYNAAQTPVSDALESFGSDLKEAVAQVISFVAVLVPWLVIIVPGLVLFRWFWRRIGRWLQRRESHA
ncbi:MAG TPA: DUF4349 domain-containing protein [Povalibacter sp.]|nr:DUF4349 domain-containing protein [Povalibacter sp.]